MSFLNGSLGITRQTNTSGTTSFVRDPEGTVISMRNSAGASFYYTTDALGSTILLTDSAQAKAATYLYDSWGNTTTQTGTQATVNPWRFAGGYKDDATGYTKFGARYYAPSIGRFNQPDPSWQEANRYLYASANPTNNTDPTGLWYLSLSAGFCTGACQYFSVNWGNDGIFFGHTTGVGFRADIGAGAVISPFGSLGGTDVGPYLGYSGLRGGGGLAGIALNLTDFYFGGGAGLGFGCSLDWTDYYKLN